MVSYGQYSRSVAQKIFLLVAEIAVIVLSYFVLFEDLGEWIFRKFNLYVTGGNHLRHAMMLTVNIMIFLAYLPSILFFVRRKITWAEAISIVLAFGVYYLGFPLLGYNVKLMPNWIDWLGALLVILGLSMHFVAELERYIFKSNPQNKGKLLTSGLWALSRHVNYFADLVWITGYALITRNWWSAVIVLLVFVFFYFFNIPIQEKYLAQKYAKQFEQYRRRVKSFIPFLL